MDDGMTAAVPAKLPRSVGSSQVESLHSHTYAQSPTVPEAGPSVRKSEKVRMTLEVFIGAIVQTQSQPLSYTPVVILPMYKLKLRPEFGHMS